MASEILNPVVLVRVRGESVEVKELTWKDHVRAVKELTGTLLKLLSGDGKTLTLTKEVILEAIVAQETLVQWIIEKSTGRDAQWVSGLGGKDFLALLKAVVDLNLSDEYIKQGKELAGQMGDIFGLRNLSLAPSITSSAPATPSKPSTK